MNLQLNIIPWLYYLINTSKLVFDIWANVVLAKLNKRF